MTIGPVIAVDNEFADCVSSVKTHWLRNFINVKKPQFMNSYIEIRVKTLISVYQLHVSKYISK